MNILPIIIRELRAEARHPVNYALRTFSAMVLTVFLGVFLWGQDSTQSGGSAFRALNFIIFCAIWIAVPLLTADCLSREKREGTLGLLFLTPLKPIEIVLGKGAIHAIRSLTLLIAGIPILAIPFVLGGITGANVFWSLLINLTAVILALAAGLLASSLCREWTRAIILAEIFSALFLFVAFKIAAISLFGLLGWKESIFDVLRGLYQTTLYSPTIRAMQPVSSFLTNETIALVCVSFAAVILFFALIILFAAHRLKNTWQENPPSRQQRWIQKTFCTPRFWVNRLRRQNQSRLSRNPIGWLQQYSWSARLSKWGWCAVVITMVSWFLVGDFENLPTACNWLKTALLISIAFSAVGSFQREKQNGALELLLVTPLREKQIILGRLWGIWGQFLPAFVIVLLSVWAIPDYFRRDYEDFSFIHAISGFIVVPIVGLYFAMRLKNFMAAWLLTCGLTLLLPPFAVGLWKKTMDLAGGYGIYREEFFIIMSRAQEFVLAIVGLFAARFLYTRLKNRTFALAR